MQLRDPHYQSKSRAVQVPMAKIDDLVSGASRQASRISCREDAQQLGWHAATARPHRG
jgi:hypothetical protein